MPAHGPGPAGVSPQGGIEVTIRVAMYGMFYETSYPILNLIPSTDQIGLLPPFKREAADVITGSEHIRRGRG